MPRRLRVLHCVTHLALGGAERVAIEIIRTLQPEMDFGVCAIRGLADDAMGRSLARELRELGVPLYGGPRVGMRYGGMLTGAAALRWAVFRFRPDVIHLHTEIPEASAATMLTLWPGQRKRSLVRTIHNSVYWHFARPLARWCDRRLGHAQIAAVSKGAMSAYLQLRRESTAPDPSLGARVIYLGVAPHPGPPRSATPTSAPIRVVFGGRFEPQKGVDLLPEVLARTPVPAGRTVELTLFGSGHYQRLLDRLARNPPAGWTVHVRPPVPEFRPLLSNFDLALLPSRFEGLCLVAVEAFLAGVAVVPANAPGLSETLPPNYPWVARVGDAGSFARELGAALAAPERWSEAAALGRTFAERRFSTESMRTAYRTLYQGAVGRPAGSTPAPAAGAEPAP
jgi:glycosyltransferase involved in cell wall biosynthesis